MIINIGLINNIKDWKGMITIFTIWKRENIDLPPLNTVPTLKDLTYKIKEKNFEFDDQEDCNCSKQEFDIDLE